MARFDTHCNCYYWTLTIHQCSLLSGTPVFQMGEIVATGADFGVPAKIVGSSDGGLRLELQYASYGVENVGIGNVRRNPRMQRVFMQMLADSANAQNSTDTPKEN